MRTQLPPGTNFITPEPSDLDALMADLALLDERLGDAVARLRETQPEVADPAHRGLVIDENDVDNWLSDLGAVEQNTAVQDAGGSDVELVGQEGGRLSALSNLFDLGHFERAMLLTALAPEVDLAYSNIYSYLQDDVTRKHATLDLVVSLWGSSVADRLAARQMLDVGAPLRRHLLINIDDSPHSHVPLLARPLLLDARITSYLLGSDEPDAELSGVVTVALPASNHSIDHTGSNLALTQGQISSLSQLAMSAVQAPADTRLGKVRPIASPNGATTPGNGLVVWMRGPEQQAKLRSATQLASALGRPLLLIDTPLLMSLGNDPRKYLYRVMREAQLQGALLYWQGADVLLSRREDVGLDIPSIIAHLLLERPNCSLFDVRTAYPLRIVTGPLSVELSFPAPSNESRRMLWEQALSGNMRLAADVDLPLLTGAFRLTGEQIEAAADTARQAAIWRAASSGNPNELHITMRDLLTACRSHSNQGLGMLSKKIVPRYTWNDLVLPIDRLSQLHEMTHHIRYGPIVFEQWGFDRKLAGGKGLNVLFAGSPGTGKTMAAEVLATDLGLELYKIDLSSIVSKYIGETEKNLEKIFREGGTSNAILFFDEADSLFGKRSQVKDSHDRYANIEISYLLQRMEEYDGIVILATNLRKNLDDAFIRRLHGAIEFPMPEELDRLEIWRRTFPTEAPLDPKADLGYLAGRFKLSGGNIKNIVLESAFFAAEAGTSITMAHLVKATRREHQKIGKLITASDFGPYASLLSKEEVLSG